MTIAVGILADEALIIASDTEESTPSHKRSVSKINEFGDHKNNMMLVAGAGPDSHIETMGEILGDALGDVRADGKASLKKLFRELLVEYYRQHILCWPSMTEREENDFQLLIGLSLKEADGTFSQSLLVTSTTTLREAQSYAAVGIGRTYANNLLEPRVLGNTSSFKETMALTAIDVIRCVKRDVPGCGKETEVRTLDYDGASCSWSWSINEDVEKMFQEFDRCVLNQLSATIISDADPAAAHEREYMSDALKNIRGLRKKFGSWIDGFRRNEPAEE